MAISTALRDFYESVGHSSTQARQNAWVGAFDPEAVTLRDEAEDLTQGD